jgi:hypothetical protein
LITSKCHFYFKNIQKVLIKLLPNFFQFFNSFCTFYFTSLPDPFYANPVLEQINSEFETLLKPVIRFHQKIYPIIEGDSIVIQNIHNLFSNGFSLISSLVYDNFQKLLEHHKKKNTINYHIVEDLVHFVQSMINNSNELESKYLGFSKDHQLSIEVDHLYIFKSPLKTNEYFLFVLLPNLIDDKQIVINFLKVYGTPIPIHDFNLFNQKISSIAHNEFTNFREIITSHQNTFSLIHEHLQKFNNKTLIRLNENENLLSISEKLVQFSAQYEEVNLLDVLDFNTKEFSTGKPSETIATLKNKLTSFQPSVLLPKDKQNSMGLINALNFLLQNCINSYESFYNISSLLLNQPYPFSYDSIGTSTERIIHSFISKIYQLTISIISESPNLSENSTLEHILNEINSSILISFDNISRHFSQQKPSSSQSQKNSLISFLKYLTTKFLLLLLMNLQISIQLLLLYNIPLKTFMNIFRNSTMKL